MSVSQEEFKELLKKKGLKVTNQRLLVLEVLADHRDRHMTADLSDSAAVAGNAVGGSH